MAVYRMVHEHGPVTIADMAELCVLDKPSLRKAGKGVADKGLVTRLETPGPLDGPLVYIMPEQKSKFSMDEIDTDPERGRMTLKHVHARVLQKIQEHDSKYWKVKDSYPDQKTHIAAVVSALSKYGFIEKWGGEMSPWVLTEKGKNTDPQDIVMFGQ